MLRFGQAVENDGGDHELREVIQKGLHRGRDADFEDIADVRPRKRLEQAENRELLDLGKQHDSQHRHAEHTAQGGGDRDSSDAQLRKTEQTEHQHRIERGIEQVHTHRHEHRKLRHAVVAHDHAHRGVKRLQKQKTAHNREVLSREIEQPAVRADKAQDRLMKEDEHRADNDTRRQLHRDGKRRDTRGGFALFRAEVL